MKQHESSLTSLVSAFSRAYHAREDQPIIFNDTVAAQLLTEVEYEAISSNMAQRLFFFSPETFESLKGNQQAMLQWVSHIQLSPIPIARAAYTEEVVENEVMLGATQYVILGAGLDTFAWRHRGLDVAVFEVDHPSTQQFKQQRIKEADLTTPVNVHFVAMDFTKEFSLAPLIVAGFDPHKKTVFSLLGVTYYLTKPLLQQLLNNLFEQVPQGSAIVFDYADEQLFETKGIYERVAHMVQLAAASGEPMHCALSLPELITMLEESELGLYEHLAPEDIQQRYFAHRTDNLQAFETIHYVHAVKMHDA